nr:transposase [Streptomyces hawaiiensis]
MCDGAVVELRVSGVGGGYPSDLTDEQWTLVEPLLPPARVGPKGGRRQKHPRRRIVDAIFYVVRTGCAWRQLPKDFPPWPLTAHRRLTRDYETIPARSETVIRWAMIGIMVRRLTRGRPSTRPGPHPLVRTAAGQAI